MQITVTIPDELVAEAEARGLSLDRYIADLLAGDLAGTLQDGTKRVPPETARRADSEQRDVAVDQMLGFAAKHGFTTAGLDLKDMLHEGHGY